MDTLSSLTQHSPMDIWPQRERFKTLVNAYRREHDLARSAMAERLDVKESHLHGLLYDKRVRPSLEVVQRAAEIFEVSITELVDDPGAAPPGIDTEKWAEASERTRVLASAMFQDLLALPDEEQQLYYELWKKGQEIGRQRLAAEAAQKAKRGPKK